MTRPAAESTTRSGPDGAIVVKAVTVIIGVVVGLTVLFGFGNADHEPWPVAPLT
ncbi:hypothetical protein [Kibdelosporangium aridum]|uniref:hypothetical protein n=1 Tax=Kibdelosporangium aridum TaxID=2030 RepID=UPI00135986B8|nr:hypothetical protein [Kibdelosporangium aridum]